MDKQKRWVIYFGVFLILLPFKQDVFGCMCINYPSVRDAYNAADGVFIGTVTKVEESFTTLKGQSLLDLKAKVVEHKIKEWKMYLHIEKTYKGALQNEILLTTMETSCSTKYDTGKQLLLYASFNKEKESWSTDPCGRTRVLVPENDDISYLNGLPGNLERTRLSGQLSRFEPDGNPPETRPLPGITIRITGPNETRVLTTDKNGFYELYDLPAEEYTLTPEIPKGLKVRFPINYGFGNFSTFLKGDTNSVKVDMKINKCIGLDFVFNADNRISGKLFSAEGKPLKNVCLGLIPIEDKTLQSIRSGFGCTKEDGSYILKDVPPGKFLLVANQTGRISSLAPFPRLFYPNTFDRKSATVITMGEGDIKDNLDLHVPSQPNIITLSGSLLFSDRKPAAKYFIEFVPDVKKEGEEGVSRTTADAQGHFSLNVLKGLSGKLYGKINTYLGEYENCPAIDHMIIQGGRRVGEAKTEGFSITADKDLPGIEMKFPFAECKKANRLPVGLP